MSNNNKQRTTTLCALALGLALVGVTRAAAPQGASLTRFTNGQVADASDVNGNFELLDAARVQSALRIDDLEARVPSDLGTRLDAIDASLAAKDTEIAGLLGQVNLLNQAIGTKDAEIADLQGQVDQLVTTSTELDLALEAKDAEIAGLQGEIDVLRVDQEDSESALTQVEGVLLDSGLVDELGLPVEVKLALLREVLQVASMEDLLTGDGGTARTLRLNGVNLQLVSGSGTTDGEPNGLGNLLIGYNEFDVLRPDEERTGSHNLVLGHRNSYLSYGGLVVGEDNVLEGKFATIVGGKQNLAEGDYSAIVGGSFNAASGSAATVTGGRANEAAATNSTVSGGRENEASGSHATVSGGRARVAEGADDWVGGSLLEDK